MGFIKRMLGQEVEYYPYGGDDDDEVLYGYCTECKMNHELPLRDWVMIKNGRNKVRLACRMSAELYNGWPEDPEMERQLVQSVVGDDDDEWEIHDFVQADLDSAYDDDEEDDNDED